MDVGSGAGTDTFYATIGAGPTERVVRIDMTDAHARQGGAERRRRTTLR